MVHLEPLPGAPRWGKDLAAVEKAALADTEALVAGGVDAVMLENFADVPFWPDRVPPTTVAAMAVIAASLRRRFPELVLGINVLRNDAAAALAVAVAVGAAFIRVNVHTGAALTDQGLLQGRAHRTLRLRRELGVDPAAAGGGAVGILADLRVKHARPLADGPLADEAPDLRQRGLADGVIVSGSATGAPVAMTDLQTARRALPDCPLLVGSGATERSVAEQVRWVDGFIVGTSLQVTQAGRRMVSMEKVSRFVAAVKAARAAESELP